VNRIFLLVPADLAGVSGRQILSKCGCFDVMRLRGEGLPLGELFAFVSGRYSEDEWIRMQKLRRRRWKLLD
jgi:hypothetical protein